jgi:hypothetical protein
MNQNTNNNTNTNQYTSLNEAYYYKPNPYLYPPTSPNCIYCRSPDTQPLLQDGSFRQCTNRSCRKQFRPKPLYDPFIQNQLQQQTQSHSHPLNKQNHQKHVNDFIMTNYPILMNQQQNPHFNPQTVQDNTNVQFSHPHYDKQLKK